MRPDVREIAAVFAGGFLGAVSRAEVGDALTHSPSQWPWSTFMVNVAGAFVLGVTVAALRARPAGSRVWRLLVGTGFCGGLTTFSTMQLEVLRMLDHDRVGLAAGYVACSVVAGLAAAALGRVLVTRGRAEAIA